MSVDAALAAALEDAIWQALEDELGAPHSGVDPAYVIPGVLERLAAAGYAIVPIDTTPSTDPTGDHRG